jgi:hypothetical protein
VVPEAFPIFLGFATGRYSKAEAEAEAGLELLSESSFFHRFRFEGFAPENAPRRGAHGKTKSTIDTPEPIQKFQISPCQMPVEYTKAA